MPLTKAKVKAALKNASVDFTNESTALIAKIEAILTEEFPTDPVDLSVAVDDGDVLQVLYDKGIISIDDSGNILIVKEVNNSNNSKSTSVITNLKEASLIDLSPEQRYLAFSEGVTQFKRERFTPVYAKFNLREKPRNLSKEQAATFNGNGSKFIDLYDVVDKDFMPVSGPLKDLCDSDSLRMSQKRLAYLPAVGSGYTRLMVRLIQKGKDHRNYNEEAFRNLISGGEPDTLTSELNANIAKLFANNGNGEGERRQISVIVPNIGEADYTISLANPQPLTGEEEIKYSKVLPVIESARAEVVKESFKRANSGTKAQEIKDLQKLAAELGEELSFAQAFALLKN